MAHSHSGSCNHDSCDAHTANRRIIREGLAFSASIEGDYEIEADDRFVQISADPDAPDAIPVATLPSTDSLESPHPVTVVGVNSDVDVEGAGTDGEQTVRVPEGKAVTFWLVDAPSEECDGVSYWADDVVAPPAP